MPLGAARLSLLAYQAAVAAAGRTAVPLTTIGATQISTSQSKFGGSSALFTAAEDSIRITGGIDQSAWNATWTFECWFRLSSLQNDMYILQNRGIVWLGGPGRGTHSNEVIIALSSAPNSGVSYYVNYAPVAGGWQTNQWYHLAVTHDNGITQVFVNGTSLGTASTGSYLFTDLLDLDIGKHLTVTNADFAGHMDEIRISDTVRYTSNFTPPTSAFTNDANTQLLIHADGADGSTTFTDDTVNPFATGGTTTDLTVNGTDYRFHVFDSQDTDDFVASGAGTVDVMLIGGGGGGLGAPFAMQAGGGAGQVLLNSGVSVSSQSYTITAGTGAAGGTEVATISDGGTTSAFGYTAIGGKSVDPLGANYAQTGGDSGNGYSGGTGADYNPGNPAEQNTWDNGGGGAGATGNGLNATASGTYSANNGTGGPGYDLTSFVGAGNTLNLRSSNLIPASLIVAEGGNGGRSSSADSTSFGSGSDALYNTTTGANGKSGAVIIRYAV